MNPEPVVTTPETEKAHVTVTYDGSRKMVSFSGTVEAVKEAEAAYFAIENTPSVAAEGV